MGIGSLIAVVDDDFSVRQSIDCFLRSVGFTVKIFPSAESFLNSVHLPETSCLILDIRMPGMTGLELRNQLQTRAISIPTIFVTADNDEEIRSQALASGAIAFLVKPLLEGMLLIAVREALAIEKA